MNILLYTSRINWRQLLVHFVAFWFFIFAFRTLSFLTDTRLIYYIIAPFNDAVSKALSAQGVTDIDLTNYRLWISISGYIGMAVAFIISLIISLKKGWFWGNSLVLINITYLLVKYTNLGIPYIGKVFLLLRQVFTNPLWEFSIRGIILLALGVFVFSFPRFNRLIESNDKTEATVAESY